MTEALVGLAAMLVLSFLRVPIAFSMGLVGFVGLWWMRGLNAVDGLGDDGGLRVGLPVHACRWCRSSS